MNNQKISKYKVVSVIATVICSALLALTVSAETANGVTLNISTDKTSYSGNESVSVSVSVVNENTYPLTDISLTSIFPTEFQINKGQSSITKTTLGINESMQNIYSIYKSGLSNGSTTVYPAVMPIAPSDKSDSDTYVPEDVSSGSGIELNNAFINMLGISADKFAIAFIISIIVITGIAMLIRNRKSIKKFLSMFLAVTILIPLCGEVGVIDVSAESRTLSASASFLYNGQEYTVSAVMTYGYDNNNTPNPNDKEPIIDIPNYNIDPIHIIEDAESKIKYIDNEIIIYFMNGYTEDMVNEVANYLNGVIVDGSPIVDEYAYRFDSTLDLADLCSLCERVMATYSYVEFATLDFIYYADEIIENVNDTWNSSLNYWDEVYPLGSNQSLESIEAISAWTYNDRLSNVRVGVVDTDFSINSDLNYTNSSSLTYTADAKNYHGTHVAGIIGAGYNNNMGTTGLLKNKSLYCYDYSNGRDSNGKLVVDSTKIYHSLVQAVDDGCKVINFSLGTDFEKYIDPITKKVDESRINDDILKLACIQYDIERAYICMNKLINENNNDFIVVQSAGNDALNDTSLNGKFAGIKKRSNLYSLKWATNKNDAENITSRIIVVGSVGNGDDNYEISSFSNRGNAVDIYAPGYNVYSLGYENNSNEVHVYRLSGTSMAALCVTAVCGMVWAANNSLTGAEVKNVITQNYNHITSDETSAGFKPVVNAKLSVEAALGINKPICLSGQITGNIVYDKANISINSIELLYLNGNNVLNTSSNMSTFSFKAMENVPYTILVDYTLDGEDTSKFKEVKNVIVARGESKNIVITLDESDNTEYIPLNSTITGTVTDSETGKTLANATVEIYTDKKYSYDDIDSIITTTPAVTENYDGTLVATVVTDFSGKYSAEIEYNSTEVDSIYIKSSCEGYVDFTSEYIDIASVLEYAIGMIPIGTAEEPVFAGGDGTAKNPYQVSTPEQLNAVRNDLTANYIQVADINLSGYSNWNPIGDFDNEFDGTYDGQGYSIKNLSIQIHCANDIQNDDIGLFGETGSSAIMKNIMLDNIDFDITHSNGALCIATLSGDSLNADIDNIKVTGDITIDLSNCDESSWIPSVGGIICWGTITNSSNYVNISLSNASTGVIGGIVGQGKAQNCINHGNITVDGNFSYIGGIVGEMNDSIYNCVNYGTVNVKTISSHVGGIVGKGDASTSYSISKCSNYGDISLVSSSDTSSNAYYDKTVGGIIGMGSKINISYCYNEGNIYCYGYAPRVGGIEGSMSGNFSSGTIKNCINNCKSIDVDNFSTTLESHIGSICSTSYGRLEDNYSYNSLRVNGVVPTEKTGLTQINGMLLTYDEIQAKINELILA